MATTKKLTPVKRASQPEVSISAEDATTLSLILVEMKKHTDYLHSTDWKLWMLMNMIRIIGEENGYSFKLYKGPDENENIAGLRPKEYNDE
jgi:hypothetical protein